MLTASFETSQMGYHQGRKKWHEWDYGTDMSRTSDCLLSNTSIPDISASCHNPTWSGYAYSVVLAPRHLRHLGDKHYIDVNLYNTHVVSVTLEKIDDPHLCL